jgi:hypothetical protein
LFNVEIEAGLSAAARTFIGKFGRPIAGHAWLDLGAVLTGSSAALNRGPFVHLHAGHVHVCLHFDIANIDKLIFGIANRTWTGKNLSAKTNFDYHSGGSLVTVAVINGLMMTRDDSLKVGAVAKAAGVGVPGRPIMQPLPQDADILSISGMPFGTRVAFYTLDGIKGI